MRSPLLGALPAEEVELLMRTARRRQFARNEVVFHRGDPADTLHLIHRGRFAVRITTPLGDTVIVSVLGPGDCFGELALFAGGERSATVVALEAGETRSLHQLDVARVRREHPELAEVLVGLLVEQVRRLSEQVVEALYVPAERRVLRRVADLADLYAEDGSPGATIPLTQDELANLAGTSRATVNKVLRGYEREGLIELRRGRTAVPDRAALHARVRGRQAAAPASAPGAGTSRRRAPPAATTMTTTASAAT